MARCSQCNAAMLISKVTNGDLRYCSAKCAAQGFLPTLFATMAESEAANPLPFADLPPPPTKPETAEGEFAEPDTDRFKDLLILGLGSAMVCAAVILIQWVHSYIGYPFFEQTFLFIIPIGAGLCGMLAGAGFWFSLYRLDRLPRRSTYALAFLMGLIGYIGIYYLIWLDIDINGVKLRNQISFAEFLQTWVENQRLRIGRGGGGKPIELGKMGYGRFLLNWLGFAIGVLLCVSIAGGRAYCSGCRRYYRNVLKQERSFREPGEAGRLLYLITSALTSGRLQLALDQHTACTGGKDAGYLTTLLMIERCPGCGTHQAKLTAQVPADKGREALEGFQFSGTSPVSIMLPDPA